MNMSRVPEVLDRIYNSDVPENNDLEYLLSLEEQDEKQRLYDFADEIRRRYVGDGILIRGIVEFSNYCSNSCMYCGLNRQNEAIKRYRLDHNQICECVAGMYADGIRTVVLQSGEQDDLDAVWLKELIEKIKKNFNIAVTLSVGEAGRREYELWREAGADRYLLKIECYDKAIYESVHPGMSFENRIRCLMDHKALGYQTGSGVIVGIKGQTVESLANSIKFFAELDIDMIGIGPFIPHRSTVLGNEKPGRLDMVLKVVALTRIITRNTHMPATTATGSIGRGDARILALQAGANVLMPNYTPMEYKKLYEIYPGKRCVTEPSGACCRCIENMAASIGRYIDYSVGHSLKV